MGYRPEDHYPDVDLADRHVGVGLHFHPFSAYAWNRGQFYDCSDCGAVVFDVEAHRRWHERGQS